MERTDGITGAAEPAFGRGLAHGARWAKTFRHGKHHAPLAARPTGPRPLEAAPPPARRLHSPTAVAGLASRSVAGIPGVPVRVRWRGWKVAMLSRWLIEMRVVVFNSSLSRA